MIHVQLPKPEQPWQKRSNQDDFPATMTKESRIA